MSSFEALPVSAGDSDKQNGIASLKFTLIVFALGWIAQLVVYAPMFKILPAGDDFPVLNDLNRGNEQGALALVKKSYGSANYRPVRALGVWLFGNVAEGNRVFSLHIMHYVGAAIFSLSALLWLRTIPLGRAGVIAGTAVVFFHPGLVASICSMDSVDSTISTGILWLGVWLIYRFRDRLVLCCVSAAICFLIGGVTKEYIFALVPLGAWTLFYLSDRKGVFRAAIVAIVLIVCLGALLMIRRYTMSGDDGRGLQYLDLNPGVWASNLASLSVGLLLPGNTMWVFLNRNSPLLFLALPAILALCAVAACGVWQFWDSAHPRYRWIVYLSVAVGLSCFPMIVMFHVSEMYLPPLVIPFALLCGVAADGWLRAPRWSCWIAAIVSLAMLASCLVAIKTKVAGMRSVGERADVQIDQILRLLPKDAANVRVAILYNTFGMKPNRHYSVFAMGDEITLVHENALNWKAPGRELKLDVYFNSAHPRKEGVKYDYVFIWDHRNSVMRQTSEAEAWPGPSLGF